MLRLKRIRPAAVPSNVRVSDVVVYLRLITVVGLMVGVLFMMAGQASYLFGAGLVGDVWAQDSGGEPSQTAPSWMPAFSWLEIESKNPWEIGVEELTYERVLYNLATKPGYRYLLLQFGVLMISLAVLYRTMKAAVALQRRMPKVAEVTVDENEPGAVVVELAGTVKITAKRGVIFGGKAGVSGEQEYASYLDWMPMIKIGRV